jgi:alkyldihydroxyacetonephosphate synthase
MVIGFDGDPDIAALQEQKAMEICAALGGQDLGREPGEKWWDHRYDFYYPPKSLKLPWMYGTTETVTTYDKIENLYWARRSGGGGLCRDGTSSSSATSPTGSTGA